MDIYNDGKIYVLQHIAKIDDMSRFIHREILTAFADIDSGVNETSLHKTKSNQASKVVFTRLCKTLFQIMTNLMQNTLPKTTRCIIP